MKMGKPKVILDYHLVLKGSQELSSLKGIGLERRNCQFPFRELHCCKNPRAKGLPLQRALMIVLASLSSLVTSIPLYQITDFARSIWIKWRRMCTCTRIHTHTHHTHTKEQVLSLSEEIS
jgi:hypothetical protein